MMKNNHFMTSLLFIYFHFAGLKILPDHMQPTGRSLIKKQLWSCETCNTILSSLGNGILLVCGSMLLWESVGSGGGPTDQYDIPTVVTCESLKDELFHRAAADLGSALCKNKIKSILLCSVLSKVLTREARINHLQ